jgi:uncharacterized repeat protein (TIGR03803 family)
MRPKKPCSIAKAVFAIFITLLPALAIVPTQLQAQTFKVLHTFHGGNGAFPITQLTRDARGNLYGTTSAGGTGVCKDQKGCGTVFKLKKTGQQVWLHSFRLSGGESPMAGLLRDKAGNLYGTTVFGGNNITGCQVGCGVVFKLDPTGKETVLRRFKGGTSDGMWPERY